MSTQRANITGLLQGIMTTDQKEKIKLVFGGIVLRGEFSQPQGVDPGQVLDVVLGRPD